MTNHIFLHKLRVNTKIGFFEWERSIEQELIIDIDIELSGNEIFKKIKLKIAKQKILPDTDQVGIVLER